jgi:elongation factor 2
MGDLLVKPEEGSVAFGSGKECWAFTTTKFSRIYASKFKLEPERRGFASFIMDPIVKLTNALMEGNMEVANKMIESIGIKMA